MADHFSYETILIKGWFKLTRLGLLLIKVKAGYSLIPIQYSDKNMRYQIYK